MKMHVVTQRADICTLYREGVGAILTSLACSVCTCTMSQLSLAICGDRARSPETQTVLSVAIFVVGYWLVYFALRRRVQHYLIARGLISGSRFNSEGRLAKLFFIGASEVFWIVALGVGNLYLLREGYSATAAAAISQWGINLMVWLPLLPLWEWFATDYLPTKVRTFHVSRGGSV